MNMSPEDQALLAQIMFGGGMGQLQAPRPTGSMLTYEPAVDPQALPPQQMMPARMMDWSGPEGLFPPNMDGVKVSNVTPAAPTPYGGPELPPLARGTPTPPPGAPMDLGALAGAGGPQTAVATNDAPMPPAGVSPAQPAGAGPALGGLFADKEEILARLGDMMTGWAAGGGGTWQDSLAAGGKMMAAGKLTRAEEKKLTGSVNKTAEWAIGQGVDPVVAQAYVDAKDAKGLIGYTQDFVNAQASAGAADPVVVGNKIVDKRTGQVIGDYGDKSGPDQFQMVPAEEVKALGLDPSRPYQRNARTGKIDPIGSSGQTIQVGSKLTETQSKDVSFLNRGMRAFDNLNSSFSVLSGAADTYGGRLPVVGNYMKSDEYRKAEQAAREVLAVILRKDTGAAITDQEMDIYGKTFLPQPGDDAATIEQKRATAKNALDAMYTGLGSLGKEFVPDYKPGLPPAAPSGGRTVIDGVVIEEIR